MNEILQTISFNEEDNTKKAYVDFRIRSDILNPQEVSQELGVTPTRAWEKGEKYLGKARNPDTKEFYTEWHEQPWGMWHLNTEKIVSDVRVEKHILYLIGLLEPKKEQLAKYLAHKKDYSIDFLIHWEPFDDWGSYSVNSDLLARMAALCHEVEFAFRATCPPEE